jgi:hypothetical protein
MVINSTAERSRSTRHGARRLWFIGFGMAHIVTGFDHLLFLLCLLIPLRGCGRSRSSSPDSRWRIR